MSGDVTHGKWPMRICGYRMTPSGLAWFDEVIGDDGIASPTPNLHQRRIAAALALPEIAALVEALNAMVGSVCGPTGFAAAVRQNSGVAYPWLSLDEAEQKAIAALAAIEAAKEASE